MYTLLLYLSEMSNDKLVLRSRPVPIAPKYLGLSQLFAAQNSNGGRGQTVSTNGHKVINIIMSGYNESKNDKS